MTELEAATRDAVRSSIETALRVARLGDDNGARVSLGRAERRLEELRGAMPSHSRVVRQCTEAIEKAKMRVGKPYLRTHEAERAALRIGT